MNLPRAQNAPSPGTIQSDIQWLARLALRLVQDEALADDAVQEAWLTASQGGVKVPDRRRLVGALRSFLWRTRRGDKRRVYREGEMARLDRVPSPEALILRAEQHRRLWTAVLAIEEPVRTAVLLRFQEGLTTRAIADREGVPQDTVRHHIRRGLERLRDALRKDRDGGGLASLTILLRAPSPLAIPSLKAALMTKTTLLCVSAAAAILVSTLMLRSPQATPEVSRGAAALLAEVERVDPLQGPKAPEKERVAAGQNELVESGVAAPPVPVAAPSADPYELRGRIIDERGDPLPGVSVNLSAYYDWHREAISEGDGTFSIDVPEPGGQELALHVVGSPVHTSPRFYFGSSERSKFGAFTQHGGALKDIGDITLRSSGAITGRLDSMGAGPEFRDPSLYCTGSSGWTKADLDGRFTIRGIAPGKQSLRVSVPGFLRTKIDVDVRLSEITEVGNVALTLSPRASGRVVDTSGESVTGVTIISRNSHRAWAFEVDGEGRFDVPLPTLDRCPIVATGPGFLRFDDLSVEGATTDLTIVMEDGGPKCRFKVIDSATGEPLPYFGVRLRRNGGSKSELDASTRFSTPGARPRAGGLFEYDARPGLDSLFIAASGYHIAHEDVLLDAAAGSPQVIELEPQQVLRGRAMCGGEPVAGARIRLSVTKLRRAAQMRHMDRHIDHESGADGRFELPLHGLGKAWIVARTRDGARVARTGKIEVPSEGPMDLGDIEFAGAAVLSGRVVLASKGEALPAPGPLQLVSTTDFGFDVRANADGTFKIKNLTPGERVFAVRPLGDAVVAPNAPRRYTVNLEAGRTQEMDIEIPVVISSTLSLTLAICGAPFPRAKILALDPRGKTIKFGYTNKGVARLSIPTGEPVTLVAHFDSCRMELCGPTVYAPGVTKVVRDLKLGRLDVEVPKDLNLPDYCMYLLHWRRADGSVGKPIYQDMDHLRGEGKVHLRAVPEGATQLELELKVLSTEADEILTVLRGKIETTIEAGKVAKGVLR